MGIIESMRLDGKKGFVTGRASWQAGRAGVDLCVSCGRHLDLYHRLRLYHRRRVYLLLTHIESRKKGLFSGFFSA